MAEMGIREDDAAEELPRDGDGAGDISFWGPLEIPGVAASDDVGVDTGEEDDPPATHTTIKKS